MSAGVCLYRRDGDPTTSNSFCFWLCFHWNETTAREGTNFTGSPSCVVQFRNSLLAGGPSTQVGRYGPNHTVSLDCFPYFYSVLLLARFNEIHCCCCCGADIYILFCDFNHINFLAWSWPTPLSPCVSLYNAPAFDIFLLTVYLVPRAVQA